MVHDAASLGGTKLDARGPEVFGGVTTPEGAAVDLAKVHPGDVLRVAILARLPADAIDRDGLGSCSPPAAAERRHEGDGGRSSDAGQVTAQ